MRLIEKLIIIICIIGILLGASAYVILYTDDDNGNGGDDKEPPEIISITGNFSITAGKMAVVFVDFVDNVNVTEATLYYQIAGSTSWNAVSILNGSASISIPSDATSNYYYYVTVDDAAGNGPIGKPSTDGSTFFTITVKPPTNDDFTHTVFVEETTREGCRYCPIVGAILETLESTQKYRFYYVSMIVDNSKAAEYLTSVYNRRGDPTVFIDGGFHVIYGSTDPESYYTSAITAAENREVPKIRVTVNAENKSTTDMIATSVLIENREQSTYTGRLRVYLTEIISSQYNDYDGTRYRNGFVDFIMNEDISVPANSNKTFSAEWPRGTLDYENLKIIAVVFSSTENSAFSDPPDNTKQFAAHYADAANATYVVQGVRNLPPEVGILSPQRGKIHFRGKTILNFLYKNMLLSNTWIIGKASIDIYAKDDSSIERVEIYVNDKLVANMTAPPYNWTLSFKLIKKPLIPKIYTITVKAYDDTNKMAITSLDVKAWWAFGS
jgi:glutaredoxin